MNARQLPLRTSFYCFVGLALTACGGAQTNGATTLQDLRAALGAPVSSMETSVAHSRLAESVVEDALLSEKTRAEVEAALGKGDPCSRHPKCAEAGFEDDDWYYDVGVMGDAPAPIPVLIVGFDHTGRVAHVWHLKTH